MSTIRHLLLAVAVLLPACMSQGMEEIVATADNSNNVDAAQSHHKSIAHMWSDRNVLHKFHTTSTSSLAAHLASNTAEPIETIIVFNMPYKTYEQIAEIDTSKPVSTPSLHSYINHYSTNSASATTVRDTDMSALASHVNGQTYNVRCGNANDLNELNANAYAYNGKTDLLNIHITNSLTAQSCVQKALSRAGGKYVAAVYVQQAAADVSGAGRKLLQSAIPSQYSKGPNVNPQYPWSSANQPDVPLINRQGPLYITPSITFGLMVGALLLLVLYIGVSTLAGVERPVRFATQPLNIGKEY